MATDDERREVAKRLRGYVSEWRDMPSFSVSKGVACSLGIGRFDGESQLLRLADLIDPGDTSQGCRDAVACDRDALLELADKMRKLGDEEGGPASYAVRCAFRVFARRIREACGGAS